MEMRVIDELLERVEKIAVIAECMNTLHSDSDEPSVYERRIFHLTEIVARYADEIAGMLHERLLLILSDRYAGENARVSDAGHDTSPR